MRSAPRSRSELYSPTGLIDPGVGVDRTVHPSSSAVTLLRVPFDSAVGSVRVAALGIGLVLLAVAAALLKRPPEARLGKMEAPRMQKLKDFKVGLASNENAKQLAHEISEFGSQFDIPGFDADKIDA